MDPLKASIIATWDRGALEYDGLVAHGRLTSAEEDAWKAVLASHLPTVPARVLEVGAGTGVMSLLIAELGYALTAIDISRSMLQEARRKAAQRGLPITFEIADAEVLPFHDSEFDAVFGRHILWTLPNPERALAEWRRVLRPPGRLTLVDTLAAKASLQTALQRAASTAMSLLQRRRSGGHGYGPAVRAALPLAGTDDPQRYAELIRAAGLDLLTVQRLDHLRALELKGMPLAERWRNQERKYLFSARRV